MRRQRRPNNGESNQARQPFQGFYATVQALFKIGEWG